MSPAGYITEPDAEAQSAAQFRKEFFEKYPDLKPYEQITDAVASRLQASGFKANSREAVMEAFAKGTREEIARQQPSQPMPESDEASHHDIDALKSSAEKGDATAQSWLGWKY